MLRAANIGRYFGSCIVNCVNSGNKWKADLYFSILSCAFSVAVCLSSEPFSASLTGISMVSAQPLSLDQHALKDEVKVASEKALSLTSSEASGYVCKAAPTVVARARTSWLPPLLFQLPTSNTPLHTVAAPASSLATPTRPLLRRSQSTSTSVTSSSFYSRSTASSESTMSRQPNTIGSLNYSTEDFMTDGSPSSRFQIVPKPEVPPIPERWKAANRNLPPAVRPPRPSTRPGLPPPAFWKYEPQCDDSVSWKTGTTSRERRNPSIYCPPLSSPPHGNSSEGGIDTFSDRYVRARQSYESLRKDGGKQLTSRGHIDARWLELDDREDRRGTRQMKEKRESRTLVKKRQP